MSRPPQEQTARGGPPNEGKTTLRRARASQALVAGFALTLAFAAGRALWHLDLSSRLLRVRAIDVRGLARTPRDRALEAAAIEMDAPLLRISLPGSQRAIEALPWVRHAAIRRQLPHRIEVQVEEHVAELAVMLQELWLVNDQGEPFKRYSARDQLVLPTVTGLTASLADDRPLGEQTGLVERLQEALTISRELARLRDDLFATEELHADLDLGWSAVLLLGRAHGQRGTERRGVVAHLGHTPLVRIDAVVATLAELADRRLVPAHIWAANEHQGGRIQVALADAQAPAD